jgi:MFS family permease
MMWLLQRFPLGRALAVCVITWGSMVLCLAACNNYDQLSAVRFFLGWFEAVVTPGFAIFSAAWYLRKEQSLRQGLYFSMSTLIS